MNRIMIIAAFAFVCSVLSAAEAHAGDYEQIGTVFKVERGNGKVVVAAPKKAATVFAGDKLFLVVDGTPVIFTSVPMMTVVMCTPISSHTGYLSKISKGMPVYRYQAGIENMKNKNAIARLELHVEEGNSSIQVGCNEKNSSVYIVNVKEWSDIMFQVVQEQTKQKGMTIDEKVLKDITISEYITKPDMDSNDITISKIAYLAGDTEVKTLGEVKALQGGLHYVWVVSPSGKIMCRIINIPENGSTAAYFDLTGKRAIDGKTK